MKYIIEVEADKIEDIRNKFKVIWESDIINGLLIVEVDCINDLIGVDGIKRIEEGRDSMLYKR